MSLKKNALATVALTGMAVAVSSAYAAGFQLTEQSSLGLGRAYAGAGIVGDDLSAAHYNAAGMTLLPGTQIQAGSVFVEVDAPFKGVNGESENGRLKGQALPAGYITHQVNDKLWLGLSMTVPYGLGTEYADNWVGAEKGNQSMLMTIDINPNIAYKLTDKLSIGAGVSLQYAKAELGQGQIVNGVNVKDGVVNGDSWAAGFNLGLMWEPTDTLRFGLAYRSQIAHDASGKMKATVDNAAYKAQEAKTAAENAVAAAQAAAAQGDMNTAALRQQEAENYASQAVTYQSMIGRAGSTVMTMDDFNVRVTTPDTIMATATWEATQDLRLSGLVRWARWSNLDELHITSSLIPGGLQVNEYQWQDTWLFSVGADYRIDGNWTVRGGVAYETSAVEKAELRTATIPDADRVWFSLGGSYNYSKQLQIDFGATYLMGVGNMDIYNHAGTQKIGEFDSLDAYIIGAQVQYRF